MNNRIKELMPKPWTFPYPDREMYSKEQMEEFAESIVKECIYAVEHTNDRYRREYFADKIREHFGVEQ